MKPSEARARLLTKFLQSTGPVTIDEVCDRFGWTCRVAKSALDSLVRDGKVASGEFLPDKAAPQFCWQANLEALHRETLKRLKAEIEPLSPEEYQDLVLRRQYAHPSTRLRGKAGLLDVIRHLEGYGAGPAFWERDVLSMRVEGFDPSWLHELIRDRAVVFGCFYRQGTLLCEPSSVEFLLVEYDPRENPPYWPDHVPGYERSLQVYDYMMSVGSPVTVWEVANETGLTQKHVGDALRRLYDRGVVTNTSPEFAFNREWEWRTDVGEWLFCSSLCDSPTEEPLGEREKTRRKVLQSLRMFGIASVPMLTTHFSGGIPSRHHDMPRASDIRKACTELVGRGEAVKGLFVRDLPREQYAIPGLPEETRTGRGGEKDEPMVMINSMDPASLHISVIPVPSVQRFCFVRRFVVLDRGSLIAIVDQESGTPQGCFVVNNIHLPKAIDSKNMCRLIDAVADYTRRSGHYDAIDVRNIGGWPASEQPAAEVFRLRGFQVVRKRLRLSLDALEHLEPGSLPKLKTGGTSEKDTDLVAELQEVFEKAAGMPVTRLRLKGRDALRLEANTLVSVPDGRAPEFIRYGRSVDAVAKSLPREFKRHTRRQMYNIVVCMPPGVDIKGEVFRRFAEAWVKDVVAKASRKPKRRRGKDR